MTSSDRGFLVSSSAHIFFIYVILGLCTLEGCSGSLSSVEPTLESPSPVSEPPTLLTPPAELIFYQTGNAEDVNVETLGPGLLLIGGGREPDDAFLWWNQQINGGDVVILRTSGSDGYNDYIYSELGGVDSVTTLMITSTELANDPWVADQIQNAEGIFLAGGDQWTYVSNWKDTQVTASIMTAWNKGALLGGSSAGLAVLGEFIFDAKEGTVTSEEALANPYRDDVSLSTDFLSIPLLTNIITDSHFAERDRMGRLVTFLARLHKEAASPTITGLGIDEATALTLGAQGAGQVYGEGAVYVITTNTLPQTCEANTGLTYESLWVKKYIAGSHVNTFTDENFPGRYEINVVDGELRPNTAY
jgi:cyanophycinase